MNPLQRIKQLLYRPTDIASLAVFRVSFGLIMLWEAQRYFQKGWIYSFFIEPEYLFSYKWFEFVHPWEGDGMYVHFYVVGILAACVMIGLFYRIASVLLFFAFSYIFLLDQVRYLNHFYLMMLVSFLLIFLPAHRKYSMDAWIWPKIKVDQVSAWPIVLLQFQLCVVYFFGGIAKLNHDWLLLAEPMKHWLAANVDYPLLGEYFDRPWLAFGMSWGGMLLDFTAPFLILNKRTRAYGFAAIVGFHILNDGMFEIGVFPWFMILATTVFFHPEWPKRMVRFINASNWRDNIIILLVGGVFSVTSLYLHQGLAMIPFCIAGLAGVIVAWGFLDRKQKIEQFVEKGDYKSLTYRPSQRWVTSLLVIWGVVQVCIPLKHFFIPGNVHWTNEGSHYSWHMMLRQMDGRIDFFVHDPETESSFQLNTSLSNRQLRGMSISPELIIQYAKYLKRNLANWDIETIGLNREAIDRYEIRVQSTASLNYRSYLPLIDPERDLTQVTYSVFEHNDWIILQDDSLSFLKPSHTQFEKQKLP